MKRKEICKRKETIYSGKILSLRRDEVELPNGRQSVREVVEHRGGVGVLPVREGTVYLVRQFRYPYGEELLEIPAGKREPGESDLACGMRELEEETGLSASGLVSLGKIYPSPGYTDEVISVFCANDWTQDAPHPDPDEFLDVVPVSWETAFSMAVSGELTDAKTVIAILRYAERMRGERQKI